MYRAPSASGSRSPTLKESTGRCSQVVHHALDVKGWIASPPSPEGARPGTCVICSAPSRPAGGRIGLHGHGFRDRQICGPPEVDSAPTWIVLACRRYECTTCGVRWPSLRPPRIPSLGMPRNTVASAFARAAQRATEQRRRRARCARRRLCRTRANVLEETWQPIGSTRHNAALGIMAMDRRQAGPTRLPQRGMGAEDGRPGAPTIVDERPWRRARWLPDESLHLCKAFGYVQLRRGEAAVSTRA